MADRGCFLALEGPDGGGKTTQAGRLMDRLAAAGREAVLVREPGGTALGERVRAVLLDPDLEGMGAPAEACLFMACRAQLVTEVIRPALERGAVVVSDRFLLSTLVYQGVVGGLPMDAIAAVADLATGGLRPDRTVVLDVPPEVGLGRIEGGLDRMERKGAGHQARVRDGYLALAREDASAIVIDGTAPPDHVAEQIWEAVRDALC